MVPFWETQILKDLNLQNFIILLTEIQLLPLYNRARVLCTELYVLNPAAKYWVHQVPLLYWIKNNNVSKLTTGLPRNKKGHSFFSNLLRHIPIRMRNISYGKLIYICKMIQPGIFSKFSQPVHFSRFKPDNLLLSTTIFSGYNLEKYTDWLNLEKMQGLIILQV